MKILIFSDTHLTNKFDRRKFAFLQNLISSADRVIINGDFWDCWFVDFDKFLQSKWKKLFPLLLKKQTIYIYGNHDPITECDHRTSLFSIKASNNYSFSVFKKTYLVEHGSRILNGKRSFLIETYEKLLVYAKKSSMGKILFPILRLIEHSGYFIDEILQTSFFVGSKIAKNYNKILKLSNDSTKFLICGETHMAEIDKSVSFGNTGCIIYNRFSYILIEDGKISLHQGVY